MTVVCPRCSAHLRPARVRDLTLDYCDPCRLVWFDSQELEAYLHRLSPELTRREPNTTAAPPLSAAGTCPCCGTPDLQPGTWRDIPLARCGRCGGILIDVVALTAVREQWTEHRETQARHRLAAQERADRRDSGDWLDDMVSDTAHDVLESLINGLLDLS